MRLFGISMVRNEADIVEAFVRHNLALLDGLAVIDHGSFDGTSEILANLQREGLPLQVTSDPNPGFFQAERMTALARQVFARERADFVFPLDADEFIKVASRERLEGSLARLPDAAHALTTWFNYVPESFDRDIGPTHLRWRLDADPRRSFKSVVGSSFVKRPGQYLISGNHLVDDSTTPNPPSHVRLAREDMALAHCPVRSRKQLESKIVVGYVAHLATRPTNDQQAFHWRDLYGELRAGDNLTETRLREIACNYGMARSSWRPVETIDLIDDPVRTSFELRYRPSSSPDALRLLMRFVEDLLRP